MANTKSIKRALLSSVVALFLCFAMLIGTTYAWFTDSVASAGNIIKSGTLDIEMYWADGTKGVPTDDSSDWIDASTGPIFEYELWEPGYTAVRHVKIANEGSLAFKYQMSIVADSEVSKLTDVIDVYYLDPAAQIDSPTALTDSNKLGTLTQVMAALSTTASGTLLAGEKDTITIALKMQESATNEYQNLSVGSSFSIKLFATQLTYEKDSFDEQYDRMATVDTEAELLEALADDYDLIMLGADVALTEGFSIPADKEVTIDLCGFKMSLAYAQTTAYAMIDNKGTLTIADRIGSGKISYVDTGAGGEYASNTIRNEGTLTITGGAVENLSSDAVASTGYPHAIDCYQGSVTNINGGTVKSANYDSIRMFCNSSTLATEVNISGGTIFNRVSFQDPAASRAGYGILNISGGNFITTDNVNANVRLLNFSNVGGNMKATITGGTFDKGVITRDYVSLGVTTKEWAEVTGGTFGIDPSDYVADGYKAVAVGNAFEVITDTTSYATASNAAELQAALDNAANTNLIVLTGDIVGDVTVKQISNLVITVNGDGHTFEGVFVVDGNSATETTSGITLKNINFKADSISADACINLGESGDSGTRYTCNVTVDNCTFDVPDAVGIKSYTGGDKNLIIRDCKTSTTLHSLAQLKGVHGVLVDGCTVKAVRGINFNNSLDVTVNNSTIDVQKYAVRFGSDTNTTVETYAITDCTLKSANVGGDPVIELRAGATNANLTITQTTIIGTPDITGGDNANIVIQ